MGNNLGLVFFRFLVLLLMSPSWHNTTDFAITFCATPPSRATAGTTCTLAYTNITEVHAAG